MSESELLLGWNLGASDPRPPKPSDLTRSLRSLRRDEARAQPWDETRTLDRVDPGVDALANGFTIHPSPEGSTPTPTPAEAGETVRREPPEASAEGAIPFPRLGDGIGGFRLVSELGRGAFGRVYLAEESGLGNRLVALKVSRPEGDEPRLLARLQHTHIVPIHSVVDDPASGLRLMCMPYFGGANLAQVLEAAGAEFRSATTGRSLIAALDIVGRPAPSDVECPIAPQHYDVRPKPRAAIHPGEPNPRHSVSSPLKSVLGRIPWWSRSLSSPPAAAQGRDPMQPARRFLRKSNFVRASAWIAARLAEGLDHAHSRGLLHRDLKPSNILIAADGTPMLLDFNLAADAIHPDGGDRAMMGGTLPYMAPEHLDAFHPQGTTPPEAVGERADIYALGLILFEMAAGRHAFDEPPPHRPILEVVRRMAEERRGPAPSPRAINREVPAGLDAIIRKALDPDPDRRHARAGDLAEDLRRFLEDRPLKFAPEPSVGEVVAKWVRRNPKLTSGSTVAVAALMLIALIVGGAWTATHTLRKVSARLRFRIFESKFQECQFLLNTSGGPVEHLGRGIGMAEAVIRQAGVEGESGDRPAESWLGSLAPEEQAEMRRDLAELILLAARARVVQAERLRSEPKRRRALESGVARLSLALRIDPSPPQALFAERAMYHAALGQATEAASDRRRAKATPPTTGRDFYLIGTAELARGRPDRAEPNLLKAVGLDERAFWAWFALGLCHYDQGRFAEAAGDFAVCTVVARRFAWPWMNRGLALARAGRLVEASEAYDRALAIEPRFPEALVNRGVTRLELGDAAGASGDLEQAVAMGRREPSTRAAMAEAMARSGRLVEGLALMDELIGADPDAPLLRVIRGTIRLDNDPKGAEADFRRALAIDPREPQAHLGLARLLKADPKAAIPHLDLAIDVSPSPFDALELRALLRARLGDPRAVADVDRLIQSPTRHRLYNAACALSLLHGARPDPALPARALDLLRRALESGFPREHLVDDPDLKPIRPDPAFRELTRGL